MESQELQACWLLLTYICGDGFALRSFVTSFLLLCGLLLHGTCGASNLCFNDNLKHTSPRSFFFFFWGGGGGGGWGGAIINQGVGVEPGRAARTSLTSGTSKMTSIKIGVFRGEQH